MSHLSGLSVQLKNFAKMKVSREVNIVSFQLIDSTLVGSLEDLTLCRAVISTI